MKGKHINEHSGLELNTKYDNLSNVEFIIFGIKKSTKHIFFSIVTLTITPGF